MENRRQLIRLEVGDFLEVKPLNEIGKIYKTRAKNFTLMGVCFTSEVEWKKGQVLYIDYFIPEELDSVRLKMVVVWSELIDSKNGYFCGGKILEVEEKKQEKFASYYYKKLKDRLP